MAEELLIPEEVETEQQVQDPPSKKLYNNLHNDGLYSKSYDEFVKKYNTPESISKLHKGLVEDELYTKTGDEFAEQYFPELSKKKVSESGSPSLEQPTSLPSPSLPKKSLRELGILPTVVPDYLNKGDIAGSVSVNQPKVTATYDDFKLHNAERKEKKPKLVKEAITNTAKKYLKNKGIVKPVEEGKAMNLSEYMQQAKEEKRLQQDFDNGDATFAISPDGEVGLKRTVGFWESLKNGWNETMQVNDEAADFANSMDAKQRVDFLRKKESEAKPNEHPEYLGNRGSNIGSVGQLIGDNAPFLVKAGEGAALGAAAILAAPETLGGSLAGLPTAMAFMFTAEDSKNQGVMSEVTRRFYQLKKENPNIDDVELMKQAENGTLAGGMAGILTNAALMTGIKTPLSLESKNVVGKAITKAIGTTVYGSAATAGIEGAKLAEGNLEGIKTTPQEVAKEMGNSFKETATTLGLLHVLTGSATGALRLPKMVSSAFKYGVKDVPIQEMKSTLEANEKAGTIPEGTTEKVIADVEGYKAALSKTVDGLTPEVEASVAGLIQAKDNLIAEQKTKDDSAKPYYEEKIAAINEQIQKTIDSGKPYKYEVDEISGDKYTVPEAPKEKGEPENISKPIELSVEPIEQPLTDVENAAIDGLKGKEFKGGIKNWTDVLQSEKSTPAEKKQALQELKEQLSDKNSEVATGEALGKPADLIYDLIDAEKTVTLKEQTPAVKSEEVISELKDVESTAKALEGVGYDKIYEAKIDEISGYDADMKGYAQEYHKAKTDGSNPELVKAIESLLTKNKSSENKPIQVETKENKLSDTETPVSASNETVDSNIGETKKGSAEKEFDKLTSSIPNGGEVKKYLSGDTIRKYEEGTELRNNQEIISQELEPALRHGIEVVEKAKEIYGDQYVEKTLDYIEKENINPENKALLYVSLENEMAKRILEEPDNLGLKKMQDLVRTRSQAYLRSNSLAINFGRLRKFAETGYDITKVTDKFFSSKETEQKKRVEKLVEADAETIQKEADEQVLNNEAPVFTELEQKVQEGVEKEINKIYEKLPKQKREIANKAIAALEKIQKSLRGKTYDAGLGIPVAIIDAGITTIKHAIKAGISIADAVELGINKIKEKYNKSWDKEGDFRKDMLDGFKANGFKEEKELNPKDFVKKALINDGFGKKIKVKTKVGVEERDVVDWKKLAGEEGSVDKISENVAKSLAPLSMSEAEINAMSKSFVDQYTDLRASVIEKGLNEIASRNKTTVTPDQKSAAKKLAEMYNYGLFDKDLEGYEVALSKTIGIDKLNEKRLADAVTLAKSMSDLYNSKFQGKRLTEPQIRSAIQVIEEKMRSVLHDEVKEHGNFALRAADLVRTYMDLTQRMTLNSLKQAAENPLSGKMEDVFSSISYNKDVPKEVSKLNRKAARNLYKEIVLEKGTGYGEVSSTFINKGSLELEIDKMSDNKLLQATLSTLIGKTTLDAVDSAYKAKITQQKFTYNLIQVLTRDRVINGKVEKGMTKQEAKNYVAEKLSGQSFKDAQQTAKEIIEKINKGAGKKIFNDSQLFIDRLAGDIVNAALVNGEKITPEMVEASYNAAYKAAGRGLGHVANNFISDSVGSVSGKIENRINEAVKQKEYNKAAMLTMYSVFFRNIANPFVGGGTNWVVLKAEKSGLGLLSGLGSIMKRGDKMDLTTDAGMKNLENAMYENLKIKDKFIRGAVGGATTVLTALLLNGVTTLDDYRKWRSKNTWAAKYADLITPEVWLATMAKANGEMKKYFQGTFNKNENLDKGQQTIKAAVSTISGDEKAAGQLGQVVGGLVGAPVPWRLMRDGEQFVVGASGGTPYKVDSRPSKTFMEGAFKGGFVDYIGLAPKQSPAFEKDVSDFIDKKGVKINNPQKEDYMSTEDYERYVAERNERVTDGIKQLQKNGLINKSTDDESVKSAVKELVSIANEQAKYEVFGEIMPEQKTNTFIKNYKPLPIKRKRN